jgi:hypothetical protein
MYWNRMTNWRGTKTRYQSSDGDRWYTIEKDESGVWVLRVSVVGGPPGSVEYLHNCTTLNHAKEISVKISVAEAR